MIDIFTLIAGNPACTALLGSNPVRFYPFTTAPQAGAKPYAVWQLVNGNPHNLLACPAPLDQYTVQLDVYAKRADEARRIAVALRAALEADNHYTMTNWAREDYEPDTQLYRVSFDADVYHPHP